MTQQETRESVILINENEKIFSIFHAPINSGNKTTKVPAILMCHGFAGQKTGKYRLYVTIAEELAKNGIAVLRIDFRGCGDSEGDFINTSLMGEVSDALKGLEFLNDHPAVDSSRLGIFGRSLGGAIAVIAAKKFKSIKSLALWAPMFSAESWHEKWLLLKKANLSEEQMKKMMVMNGQLAGEKFLTELFEMRLGDELASLKETPLLHIQAEMDNIVTVEHTLKYKQFRSGVTAKTEFISFENSDHDFSNFRERDEAVKKTVSWFINTL